MVPAGASNKVQQLKTAAAPAGPRVRAKHDCLLEDVEPNATTAAAEQKQKKAKKIKLLSLLSDARVQYKKALAEVDRIM